MSRFVVFALNYAPEPTGNAPYTTAYTEALAAAGHDVTVITGYQHYPHWTAAHRRWHWTTEWRNGVRLLRVPHTIPTIPDAHARFSLEASYGLASLPALVGIRRPDATIGVIPSLSGGLAARVTGVLYRRPVGLLVQDLMSAAVAHGGVPGTERLGGPVSFVERRVVRGAHVAAVARGFSHPLQRMGPASVTYLPNFATLPVGIRTGIADMRKRLGIPLDAFVVGYSGNLGYKQDFHTVLAAAGHLKDDRSIFFAIVGDGSQRNLIDEAIAVGRVNALRLPLQPAEDVLDILRSFDLLLAPQRSTDLDMSIPSKLTAYLSAGRPVLAAASSGSETAAQVEASGAGLVIPPGDAATLAHAIVALRADPVHLRALAAAGAEYARYEFDRDAALVRFTRWAVTLATNPTSLREAP